MNTKLTVLHHQVEVLEHELADTKIQLAESRDINLKLTLRAARLESELERVREKLREALRSIPEEKEA